MNIFAFFRKKHPPKRPDWLMEDVVVPKRAKPKERPKLIFKSHHGEKFPIEESPPHDVRIFEATHIHFATGKLYMLTNAGERLEVTGDDAYPLAEYEDADGKSYAQRWDRFHDGRFKELPL